MKEYIGQIRKLAKRYGYRAAEVRKETAGSAVVIYKREPSRICFLYLIKDLNRYLLHKASLPMDTNDNLTADELTDRFFETRLADVIYLAQSSRDNSRPKNYVVNCGESAEQLIQQVRRILDRPDDKASHGAISQIIKEQIYDEIKTAFFRLQGGYCLMVQEYENDQNRTATYLRESGGNKEWLQCFILSHGWSEKTVYKAIEVFDRNRERYLKKYIQNSLTVR